MSVRAIWGPVGRRACGGTLALLATAALAGCGLGAGSPPSGIKLTVTEDFGASQLRSFSAPKVVGQETVMSLLMRNATVTTRYGGGFVQSVDGRSGGEAQGEPVDWFYYVNGVQAPKGAAQTVVHPGDRVWWDRHDWSQAESVPAVVGSFPEPFLNGIDGKRLPVRVECATQSSAPCATVASRLREAGVTAGVSGIEPGAEPLTLRVLVGPWSALKGGQAAQAIAQGPDASGVYARFVSDGSLTLLDGNGRSARVLSGEAGLVAATSSHEEGETPTWLVTGTDEEGVELAARALSPTSLADRFAVALTPGSGLLSVPAGG
jgi:Domain of unknown function (DUF4430)